MVFKDSERQVNQVSNRSIINVDNSMQATNFHWKKYHYSS